jgi:hypothetical protein
MPSIMEIRMTSLSRRSFLVSGTAALGLCSSPALAATGAQIHVVKDPNCGCCTAWVEILVAAGFAVTTEDRNAARLNQIKRESGIPPEMTSCHTAQIEGYVLEGHVPVADIQRLLEEQHDAVGLAVPGMPYGSPGMGPESERDAFDVFLLLRDGRTEVFSSYEAA